MEELLSLLTRARCLDENRSCNFQGPLRGLDKRYLLPSDAEDIIFQHCPNDDKDPCHHCGYGNEYHYILKFKDGNYGYIKLWSGCLSYSPHVANVIHDSDHGKHELEYASSYEDIVNLCMTRDDREACGFSY